MSALHYYHGIIKITILTTVMFDYPSPIIGCLILIADPAHKFEIPAYFTNYSVMKCSDQIAW